MKQKLDKLIDELNTKSETLEQVDKDGKPIGSGWAILFFNKLSIDIFETKAMRASSYIPTREQYSNTMCGLVNNQSHDELCYQWCMRYHQSAKGNHDSRLSKLEKVADKYNYDGMEFPASYEAISAFDEIKRVCIFIYELDSDDQIRLGQRGNIAYLTDDLIYLLRIEADSKSHYIYIKNIDHFFNLHTHTHDTDERFCPICSKKVLIYEFRSHISTC